MFDLTMKFIFSAACLFVVAPHVQAQSCRNFRFQFLTLQQGFTAFVASPNELRVQVNECAGAPFTNGRVVADFNTSDRQLVLEHKGGGIWSADWIPVEVTGREVAITLFASTTLQFDGDQIVGSVRQTGSVIFEKDTTLFNATASSPRATQTLSLMNVGTRPEQVRIAASETTPWLSVSPNDSTVSPRQSVQVSISVDPATAGLGPHSGSVTVISEDGRALGTTQISLLVDPTPQLTASTASVAVTQNARTPPTSRPLQLTNNTTVPIGFSLSAGAAWVSFSPNQGTIEPGQRSTVTVSFNALALEPGVYNETLVVQHSNGARLPVPLLFNVRPQPVLAPTLTTDSAGLEFTSVAGGSDSNRAVNLKNLNAITLRYAASTLTRDGNRWLTVSPSSGAVDPDGSMAMTVTASPIGLQPGTYEGQIFVNTGQGGLLTLTVVQVVGAGLQLSGTSLSFEATAGAAAPAAQTLSITNRGTGTLGWTITTSTTAGGNWLAVNTTSGTSTAGAATSPVSVSVQQQGLAPGTYSGEVRVSTAGSSEVLTVPILLTVQAAPAQSALSVTPLRLAFTAQVGGANPAAQAIQVRNGLSSAVSVQLASSAPWLILDRTQETIAPQAVLNVAVQARIQDLRSGQYPALVTVARTGAPSSTVSVVLTVTESAMCTGNSLRVSVIAPTADFVATVGRAVPLEVAATDNCGRAITVTGVTARARFSTGEPDVTLAAIAPGRWGGTWVPRGSPGTRVSIMFTAIVPAADRTLQADLASVNGVIKGEAGIPVITREGVLNSATLRPGNSHAPGTLVAIFGSRFSECTAAAAVVPLPTELCGTEVRLADRALPLLYVGPDQINAQLPYDVPVNSTQQLLVRRGNVLSFPEPITIVPAMPGVFTMNQTGTGAGIALTQSGLIADMTNPLRPGQAAVIFAVGLGLVDPPIQAGAVASASAIRRTVAGVTVTIGGQTTGTLFAGLAPGFIGLYQVNFTVPPRITTGDAVPLTITAGGQTSPPVTVPVR
jgi:uncharacterized protein (TIGR03437 family)